VNEHHLVQCDLHLLFEIQILSYGVDAIFKFHHSIQEVPGMDSSRDISIQSILRFLPSEHSPKCYIEGEDHHLRFPSRQEQVPDLP
jgi:hypothetical protein